MHKKHPLYCDILGLYHKELVTYLTLWQTGYVAQWVDALSKTNIGSVSEWCRWKVEQKLKMAMSLLCDVILSYLREVKTILHFNFFFFFSSKADSVRTLSFWWLILIYYSNNRLIMKPLTKDHPDGDELEQHSVKPLSPGTFSFTLPCKTNPRLQHFV